MNCKEANSFSIIGYLASQGINPIEVKNGSAWYCSPFRSEAKPSFKVNQSMNQWYDFGSGEHGTLIDLVCKLTGSSVSGALLQLQKPEFQLIPFISGQQEKKYSPRISIISVLPIKRKSLKAYLRERGISIKLGIYYLKEIVYSVQSDNGQEKTYYALGFKNDLQGFELRSKYFKGCTSKAVTTIPGGNRLEVNLFEGFFDFLSAVEYPGLNILASDNIILNSVNNLAKTRQKLSECQKINLFMDNDETGRKTSNWIKAQFSNVTNYSEKIYPGFKDFNEFYCSPGKSK